MKLSAVHTRQAIDQMERLAEYGRTVTVPDDNPALPKLVALFGEHTFFLNNEGLHIVEPDQPDAPEGPECQVVKLAGWGDAERTSLAPQDPEPAEVVVMLQREEKA